jgi:hypothetical protein
VSLVLLHHVAVPQFSLLHVGKMVDRSEREGEREREREGGRERVREFRMH